MIGPGDAWDPVAGSAGGQAFGSSLFALASERDVLPADLVATAGLAPQDEQGLFEGSLRLTLCQLARLIVKLRLKPIEFMQRTGILSLEVYAHGLDPLYFLPEGGIRYDARIYMREINPRHAVPESDMTKRNPAIRGLVEDPLLDPLGKVELELAYLLRVAARHLAPG